MATKKVTKPSTGKVLRKPKVEKEKITFDAPPPIEKKAAHSPITKSKIKDHSMVRPLIPKDPDTKYFGLEPVFPTQPEDHRDSVLARGFNWYNRFYGRKDAREMMAQYLDLTGHPQDAKVMRRIDEKEFMLTLCWLARMNMRGLQLTEHEDSVLHNEINRLLKSIHKPEVKTSMTGGTKVTEEKKESNRPNVQEIMRDKAREAGGDLEGLLDEFISAGAPTKNSLRPIDAVAKKNVLPQHISMLTEVWKKKQDEFEEVLKGKDKQLVEGYSHYSKTQIKNIIKFIEQVITDLNGYVNVKKAAKAPRARKPVPVEKQVSKLKYLREFKDPAMKLDLVSLHPVKLHGASEAWVYDTAKRKLHHYIADEYSKEFTVKGNTLIGFDKVKSEIKTLRKPAEQIKEVMGSKPAARKFFDSIKAVSVSPNGRFNDSMIILKAF